MAARLPGGVDRTVAILVAVGAGVLVVGLLNGRIRPGALVLLAVVIPSIILHEVSHGVVALASVTTRRSGRAGSRSTRSKHVDPFGTLILPAMLALAGRPPSATPSRCR